MKNNIFILLFSLAIVSCEGFLNQLEQANANTPQIDPAVRDSIKTVIHELSSSEKEIKKGYFTYFGFRDWYRWPLVYPYSLNSIDIRDDGFICDERHAEDIAGSQNGIDQIYLGDIKAFTFNGEVLLAETGDAPSEKYKLFRFSDQQITSYASLFELMRASSNYGKMVIDSLITVETYSLFFGN